MISAAFITHWRSEAPWFREAQIEQDLVLSRALVEIFNSETGSKLALRGGTALYKLFVSEPVRYSEDIDLVQISPEPIGSIFDGIKEKLNPILGSPVRTIGRSTATLKYRFVSEYEPVEPLRLKIEINIREHHAFDCIRPVEYAVNSPWFTEECTVKTFSIEELTATKIRALYQRRKGRDLFDLWYVFSNLSIDVRHTVGLFKSYMESDSSPPSFAQFKENLDLKMEDRGFVVDTNPIVRREISYKPSEARDCVLNALQGAGYA